MAVGVENARKSGRKRKISQKAAETVSIDDTQIFGSSPEPQQLSIYDRTRLESEESEFDEAAAANDEEAEADAEDEEETISVVASQDEEESLISNHVDDDISDIADSDVEPSNRVTNASRKPRQLAAIRQSKSGVTVNAPEEPHSSGAYMAVKHSSKEIMFRFANGNDLEEATSLLGMRDKWLPEITSPSRKPDAQGRGGMMSSFLLASETRQSEADEGCAWIYRPSTISAFKELQQDTILTKNLLAKYLSKGVSIDYVLGGSQQSNTFSIHTHEAKNLNDIWLADRPSASTKPSEKTMRHGWLLNVGESVHCMQWIPGQTGRDQYLTVAHRRELSLGKESIDRRAADTPSAFVPGKPAQSAIEIWQLSSQSGPGHEPGTIDNNMTPKLHVVLCFDYGLLKKFDWCPLPRTSDSEESPCHASFNLLATVHDDGVLRVFKILVSFDKGKNSVRGVKLSHAAFEARPPETIHTSLSWISSSLIAAGCANGFVAIYDLDMHFKADPLRSNGFPITYEAFHHTYILSLTSCLPSRPHLLVSTAMDGYWRVTDLRDPTPAHALAKRERFPPSKVVWYEQSQGILSSDEQCNVRFAYARSVEYQQYVTNVDASIRDIAVSPVHASTLVACADGGVWLMNPIRILHKGRVKAQDDNYRQKWFKHDWRRGRPKPAQSSPETLPVGEIGGNQASELHDIDAGTSSEQQPAAINQIDFPQGLSRLTSGYRLEGLRSIRANEEKYNSRSRYRPEGIDYESNGAASVSFSTIYERETAVKAVAWNPNISAGGWAAGGMGNGLVMIEDLCWD